MGEWCRGLPRHSTSCAASVVLKLSPYGSRDDVLDFEQQNLDLSSCACGGPLRPQLAALVIRPLYLCGLIASCQYLNVTHQQKCVTPNILKPCRDVAPPQPDRFPGCVLRCWSRDVRSRLVIDVQAQSHHPRPTIPITSGKNTIYHHHITPEVSITCGMGQDSSPLLRFHCIVHRRDEGVNCW